MPVIGRALVVDGLDIAVPFGIRVLAKHDDRYIRLRLVAALRTEGGSSAGGRDRRADSVEYRGGPGKVCIGVAGSLPGDRPAAGLLADVVGAIARDQYLGPGRQRQQALVILQ